MEQTTVTYQCPNCGAALSFDAEKQKFTCEFCMSEFDRSELEEAHASEQAQAAEENARDFCDHMLEYHCPSCGAEITADENTAADFCYYCHNPVLLTGKLSGQMKPDKIIPFRYNKQQAEERFLKDVKRKWFIPRDFFLPGQTEKFSGVYFPFWITDADTKSYAKGKATRTRVWQDSRYRYTETSHYLIEREGNIHFEDIVTSAISDGDKAMLEGILPYPSEALQDFSMPYLSGFTAKKRNIEREALNGEVLNRMREYSKKLLRGTVTGYDSVSILSSDVRVLSSHWEYSLLPTWILTYQGKKKKYTYAMNGYTGKVYGEYPFSLWKVLLVSGIVGVVAGVLAALLKYFLF